MGQKGDKEGKANALLECWICQVIVEIVILAMIAAFLGLRLYSVLGQRAEHEEESIPHRFDAGDEDRATPASLDPAAAQAVPSMAQRRFDGLMPAVERGVRDIASADAQFDITAFLEGAKGAYEMVLEAFWKGDRETLKELCDGDVYASFTGAIDAREAAGHTLDNKLIRIEETRIHSAVLDGRIARVAVLFVADIAAVTRDKDGNVIAGSLDDAVESRDVWTFSRDVRSSTPDWILDETDEG
jgi:predicted lipid-binding transport protein (Tim44 family)